MKRRACSLLALVLLLACAAVPPVFAQAKDTVVVGYVPLPDTLDPHMHFQRTGILMNINMYDSLLHKNTKMQYEPSLATSWKSVNDTTWEFKIRKGVKFHNGDTMTNEDVKFSFDRVLDQKNKSPQYGNIRAIKEVKIVDADTVHLITDKPYPLLLERLVFFPIIPKKHYEKVGAEVFGAEKAIGTGPWKVAEYKRDQHIKLEAFDQHWRGKPPFKNLIFRGIAEVATQVAELKTGGVDIIRNVSADLVPDLKNNAHTYISTAPILRTHYMAFDMRVEPFNKKLVRQAANYAIDREAVVQKMMAGLGKVVPTVVNPMAFGFDASVTPYSFDPKKAKELLKQAGYPNGVDVTLHSGSVEWRPVFEALCQMMTEVGIRATPKMWDPGPAWNKFFQADGKAAHGFYGTWGYYSVFDADAILHPLYHTEPGGWVGKHYARVEGLDQLIDQARSTVDANARKRSYTQIQKMIKEEAPSLFLFHQFETLGISKKVQYAARGDEWLWLFDAKIAK
jgi:peptide/nickel transport system substrate-binding protein